MTKKMIEITVVGLKFCQIRAFVNPSTTTPPPLDWNETILHAMILG